MGLRIVSFHDSLFSVSVLSECALKQLNSGQGDGDGVWKAAGHDGRLAAH